MTDGLVDLVIDKLSVACLIGPGVDITLVSTDVEGSTELWEWVSAARPPALLPEVRMNACICCYTHSGFAEAPWANFLQTQLMTAGYTSARHDPVSLGML